MFDAKLVHAFEVMCLCAIQWYKHTSYREVHGLEVYENYNDQCSPTSEHFSQLKNVCSSSS